MALRSDWNMRIDFREQQPPLPSLVYVDNMNLFVLLFFFGFFVLQKYEVSFTHAGAQFKSHRVDIIKNTTFSF